MRRPMAVVLAAVLALTLGGVQPAPAAEMTAVMPGFTAAFSGRFQDGACGGAGPTSVVVLSGTLYFAADVGLYAVRPGKPPTTIAGPARPWGITLAAGKAYGSQPACGTDAVENTVEDNCNIVEFQLNNGKINRAEVADFCAFALATDPRTGNITAAGRDGRVVLLNPASGAEVQELFAVGNDPAVSLAWAPDGSRLFGARRSGAAFAWARGSGGPRALTSSPASAVAIGNGVNMPGSVLIASGPGTPVRAVAVDPGAAEGEVAASSSRAVLVVAVAEGIYVAQPAELWLLRGRYTPPPRPGEPPPPARPPPTIRPSVTPTSIVQSVAPAPPVQAPPPPPPPAPPAPPLATAAQVVAQPSAVANPAIVPGESEREAAMRLAATGRPRPLAPYLLWLALATVLCAGGLGAGIAAGRRSRSDAGRYAWAETR